MGINGELVVNPRVNGYFEMYAGTSGFTFLQNIVDGSQQIVIFKFFLGKSVEFFGEPDIPNHKNKIVKNAIDDGLSALSLTTYTKTEVGALTSNINLAHYYTKAETDSPLTNYSTISYLQGNCMTALAITETLMNKYAAITFIVNNFYPKAETDSTLSDYITTTQTDACCYTRSEIDTTLNLYSPSAQLLHDFYSKLHIDNTFKTSAHTGTQYYNKAETDKMLLSYSTGSYVGYTVYTEAGNDTILANKISNTGYIELPGWLDICTSNDTNPRIRCNAEVNGYTGCAELRAASSYDMYLNLSTTRTDGGWMYFEI